MRVPVNTTLDAVRAALQDRPMTVEIERKFLLDALPEDLPEGVGIRQGYIAVDGDVSVRVRLARGRGILTIKAGTGRERVEVERELEPAEAEALWPLTEGRRVEKTRSVVPLGADLRAEVDVFEGTLTGLLVAEVEFPDGAAADAFVPPPWFGREVTGEAGWGNASLALHGRPDGQG